MALDMYAAHYEKNDEKQWTYTPYRYSHVCAAAADGILDAESDFSFDRLLNFGHFVPY